MSNILQAIKDDRRIIQTLLYQQHKYEGWTLQGFGMLRLYLTKELRLHVWDSRYRVPNVSLLHTHPWDFESYIASGMMMNYRYEETAGDNYMFSVIKCGAGGCAKTDPAPCGLKLSSSEVLGTGETYTQKSNEIHKSLPDNGTVTLVERTFKEDTEHARVFWNKGGNWVSAEPRSATREEVKSITELALDNWR